MIQRPNLIVMDISELQKERNISKEMISEIIRIQQSIPYTNEKDFFLSIVARYMNNALEMSHYNVFHEAKHNVLNDLLKIINEGKTKKVRIKIIDDLLEKFVFSYIDEATLIYEVKEDTVEKTISILKEYPEYLTINVDELENNRINKLISESEEREILRIRQSTDRIFISIYWLIILRALLIEE